MPDVVEIPVANLLLDTENPRLITPNGGQRETLRDLARLQGPKIKALAQDILKFGINPSELTIVTGLEDGSGRFVVLDGNRRLAALRLLENPELVEGVVTASLFRSFRKMSRLYQERPIEEVSCVEVQERDEAHHWLELRHMGERDGAGPVFWGSQESARFRARTGNIEPHIQALHFLQARGDISPERRAQVAATTLRRLLGTPYVRERLGLELVDGTLQARGNDEAVAKALLHVINDIADKTIKVNDVYTTDQRKQYADDLPDSVVPTLVQQPGSGIPLSGLADGTTPTPTRRRRRPTIPPQRKHLIPTDCVLNVTEPRLREIERELRHLDLESHPNAVSVLLRVFLELTIDSYISARGLGVVGRAKLGTTLLRVTGDLEARQKLTAQQGKPARRAAQKDTFLGPSVTQMHEWIHNQHMFPGPADLRSEWNGLQPWFIAVWSP